MEGLVRFVPVSLWWVRMPLAMGSRVLYSVVLQPCTEKAFQSVWLLVRNE